MQRGLTSDLPPFYPCKAGCPTRTRAGLRSPRPPIAATPLGEAFASGTNEFDRCLIQRKAKEVGGGVIIVKHMRPAAESSPQSKRAI